MHRTLACSIAMTLAACGGKTNSSRATVGGDDPAQAPAGPQLTIDSAGGGTDATDFQQHVGPNVSAATSWEDGSEDTDGVLCDAAAEGLGWCLDHEMLYACHDGLWRSTSCKALGADLLCGRFVDPEGGPGVVDCEHDADMLRDPQDPECCSDR